MELCGAFVQFFPENEHVLAACLKSRFLPCLSKLLESQLPGAPPVFTFKDTLYTLSLWVFVYNQTTTTFHQMVSCCMISIASSHVLLRTGMPSAPLRCRTKSSKWKTTGNLLPFFNLGQFKFMCALCRLGRIMNICALDVCL